MKKIFLLNLLLSLVQFSYSQESTSTDTLDNYLIKNNLLLKEISIHTTLNVEDNKTQIIRLDRKEISNSQSNNTAELLEKTTAIVIQKSQNGGGSPNIRGFEANRILLVVDGVKLNNTIYRSGHLQSILSVDQNIIDNLSVLHGPSSIFYGSGALGGAIVINTINPYYSNKNYTSFSSQFESSSNSFINHIHNITKFKNISNIISLSYKKFGNLTMGANRLHGYDNWGIEEFATEKNIQLFGSYSQIDLNQKTHFQLNEKSEILINNQFSTSTNINRFDKLNDINNNEAKYKLWYYGPQKRLLNCIKYTNKEEKFYSEKTELLLSHQQIIESRHHQKNSDNFITNRIENIHVYDSKISFNKQYKKWDLNYGISGRYQNLKSTANTIDQDNNIAFATTRYPDNGSEVFSFSSFLLSEYHINSNIKYFNAIRFDKENLSAQFSENNLFNLNDKIELQNSNISASSNLSYYLGDKNFVSLSIYNAFRNPNIDDIGKVFSKIDGIVVVPNVSLQSEKIVSTELMYRLTNENNKIEFCVFATHLKDAIAKREITINDIDSMLYDGEMMKMIANTNINSARMFGVNFNFYQKLSPKIDVNLNSSYVNGSSSDTLPLAHIPPLSIRGELNFKSNKKSEITFYTKYNAWKKVINFDANGIDNIEEATIDGTPSWYTLNLRYTKQLNKIRISVSCENILDAHYKTFASGLSASGRNFIVSLQTNF